MKTKCNEEEWKNAQIFEKNYWRTRPFDGDDWNKWWAEKFDDYSFLGKYAHKINNACDVGCGPYAKNLRLIIEKINIKPSNIILIDPLLNCYVEQNKFIKTLIENNKNIITFSTPLEKLKINIKTDLIVCINVLEHTYDMELCFKKIYELLNDDGIFILGEDLTNDDDIKEPEIKNDIGHPIRLTVEFIDNFTKIYKEILYRKILKREDGRCPLAHYGTYLFAGIK